MDVLFNQLVLNQLWQSARVASPLPSEGAGADFRDLLATNVDAKIEPNLVPVEQDNPSVLREEIAFKTPESGTTKNLLQQEHSLRADKSTHLTQGQNLLPVIQNPYRWFATGIMSFEQNLLVESVNSPAVRGDIMGKGDSQTRSSVVFQQEQHTAAIAKDSSAHSLQLALTNNVSNKARTSAFSVESLRPVQHFSVADYLKKRCTIIESSAEIHIIVRDYGIDENEQIRIGEELLQVFSQLDKSVRLTWNGKGHFANKEKGEQHAG